MARPHERARAVLGAPFRLHGRDAARGFDCLGLVLHAYEISLPALPRYRFGDGDWETIEASANIWFDHVQPSRASCDDLVITRYPRGFHFALLTERSTINADCKLGRVVERPLGTTWPEQTRFYRHQLVD